MTLLRPNLAVLFAFILFSSVAQAESVDQMTENVCAQVKLCSTEEISKQGLSAEMESMMHMMFDSMCTSIVTPYVVQTKDAGLESMANACMRSVESIPCDKIINQGGDASQACIDFEKAAKEAGIDTNTSTIFQ